MAFRRRLDRPDHPMESHFSVVRPVAQSLGLPLLSAFLDALGSNFSHGVNFATADGDGVFKRLIPKVKDFSRALYTFDIGQNDLVAGLFQNLTVDEVRASVPNIVGQFKTVVKLDKWTNTDVWVHTMKLKQTVDQLREDLPKPAITYVDVYSVKSTIDCGDGGKYNFNMHIGCGGKFKINGKDVLVGKTCEDPTVMINRDGVHYTQAANKWIFDQIVNGSFSDLPIPIGLACHKQY
ncbi:hypothetical protein L1987_11312 [Smallanthus sonchifolius]|uniref:Uncharacterized protein n=1 Tax=Smallanthus sonchifolius TaxID=185202 RepID=A0ACB9JD86_9ASTR|nr:hypothetical protein L1987_11312 [Smallanthus sonchifolius]